MRFSLRFILFVLIPCVITVTIAWGITAPHPMDPPRHMSLIGRAFLCFLVTYLWIVIGAMIVGARKLLRERRQQRAEQRGRPR